MGTIQDGDIEEDMFPEWNPPISVFGQGHLISGEWAVLVVATGFAIAGSLRMAQVGQGVSLSRLLLDWFLNVGLALGAILGGVVLRRSEFNVRERWLAANWYMGGILFILGLVLWSQLPAILEGQSIFQLINPFLFFANLGGIMGIIAGFNRARSAQNARLIRQVELQRDQLAFINSLLRHNVLNSIQAVNGYADLIDTELTDEQASYMKKLQTNTDRITELINDVRVLISTLEGTVERRPIDLSEILVDQVTLLESKYEAVEISHDIPPDVTVQGATALSAVFENLLDNAVAHNDRDVPEVSVTLTVEDGRAMVTIRDNGPGIPADIIEQYVESPSPEESRGDSFGLYLARVLVDIFDGKLSITDRDPRGSTVRVSLPAVD